MEFKVKRAEGKKEVLQAIFLRRKVLVHEFGYSSYKNEPDRFDLSGEIYIATLGSNVIGTVRVRKDGDVYHIQRAAIDSKFRKKGAGSLLLKKVLANHSKVYVMAPKETIPFYEKYGFKKTKEQVKGKVHIYFRLQNY